LKSQEDALERLSERAISVLDELERAEEDVRALERTALAAEADVKAAARRLSVGVRAEDEAKAALIAELSALAPRLRLRYRLSRMGEAGLFLSARTVGEVLSRKRLLDRLLTSDLAELEGARKLFDRLAARRAELEAIRTGHAQRARIAKDRRAVAKGRKEDLGALHDSLMDQKLLRLKTLAELYARQAKLGKLLSTLRPEPAAPGPMGPPHRGLPPLALSSRRGRLPFPTKGFVEVGFGKVLNPRFNTVTFQNGIDVRAPEGTEVVSVAPGTVVHAGPFKGYGTLVIIDHGGGYHTLYAHLSVATRSLDEAVDEGDLIGLVGDTGSLKGAYLYFEIRDRGKPVNPKGWFGAP
jgi:septal ring factor EnvC (AmiA/AmiB activator)